MNKKARIASIGLAMLSTVGIVEEVQAKQVQHKVAKGDTVYSIAKKYGISTTDLINWNGIKDNIVVVGRNVYTVNPYHTVQKGDTLYSVATSNGLSVADVKNINGLNDNIIKLGQKLLVVKSTEEVKVTIQQSEKPQKEVVKEEQTKQENIVTEYYVVKKGDTLYKISVEQGITLSNLREWNGITTNSIYVGQQLKINRKVEEVNYIEMYVESTAYTATCKGCSGITSTGINLIANPDIKVIAVDPNIIKMGSRVWVEGYGEAIAADKGTAIKGNKIDVYLKDLQDALKWGRKTVKIRIYQ